MYRNHWILDKTGWWLICFSIYNSHMVWLVETADNKRFRFLVYYAPRIIPCMLLILFCVLMCSPTSSFSATISSFSFNKSSSLSSIIESLSTYCHLLSTYLSSIIELLSSTIESLPSIWFFLTTPVSASFDAFALAQRL